MPKFKIKFLTIKFSKIKVLGFLLFCLLTSCGVQSPQKTEPIVPKPSPKAPIFKVYSLPEAEIYTLQIFPNHGYEIRAGLMEKLGTVEEFAKRQDAIAVLNAGFFDPQNAKSTSTVVINGSKVAEPSQNERLMGNSSLKAYLPQILNRREFRRYRCHQDTRYAIALRQSPIPVGCTLQDAVGGGPQLLPELTLEQEGFIAVSQGRIIRDALSYRQDNARTAVGLLADGSVLWVMVGQTSSQSGLSLPALASFLKTLGVVDALNFDGGSSTSLYYQGNAYDGKFPNTKRRIKSVLWLKKEP